MSTLVVFESNRWVRVDDGEIAARGEEVEDALPIDEGDTVVAILSGREATVRVVPLPDLTDAQANSAARVAVAAQSLSPAETLHTTAGPADSEGRRTVVAVEAARVTQVLLDLAANGLDPDRLLVEPLLLPIVESGFVRATFDQDPVVRGTEVAFVEEAIVAPLVIGDATVATLDRPDTEEALIRSIEAPGVDLRHGVFAKRRRLSIDIARLRRLAAMALALGLIVLSAQIVHAVRLDWTASRIETENRTKAAAILPPGTVVIDPALQAEARLTALQGAGGGFGPLAATFATAVNAVPGVELGSMIFDGEGGLRATVRAPTAAELATVEARLTAAGLRSVAGPIVNNQGRPYRDITVSAR